MDQPNYNRKNKLNELISVYEVMSQKGTVGFFEEKVFFDFINHYTNEHAFEKALQVAEHALTQHTYSAELFLCKATLLFELNKNFKALTAIEQALKLSPTDSCILQLRSEIRASILASKNIHNNMRKKPTNKKLPSYNHIFRQLNNIERVYEDNKIRLRNNPHDEDALKTLMLCIEVNQKYYESISFHEELINAAPYSYLAWFNLGKAHYALGQYKSAANAFEYSFLIQDTFILAYKEFARSCFKLRQHERALAAFEDLVTKAEPDGEMLTYIGECYERREDYKVAYLFYTKAMKLDPELCYTHFRVAESFCKQMKWKLAIEAYEKAISVNPKDNYYLALGDAYYQIGNIQKAFECFELAADTAPDVASNWVELISFLIDTEQYERALDKVKEARTHIHDSALEYCEVACLYLMKEKSAAKELLTSVLCRHYKDHELLFEYAPEAQEDKSLIALINFCNCN